MGARSVRFAVVVGLAAVMTFVLATSAPGSVSAVADLDTLPGLEAVNYGQVAAYTARIENTGNVTLKNVRLRNPIPFTLVDGQPQPAVFQSAGCTGTLSATEFSCVVADKLPHGQSLSVTIAWKTPAQGSSPGCSASPCLVNTAFWETGPFGPYTFGSDPAETALLASNDPSKAATYATAACTNPASPTLATDPNVSVANPLSTSVCAPNLPANAPGLVSSIEERNGEESEPGITQVSDICLPSPGTGCDQSPFVFSSFATFTFVVSNASLPQGETIDTVYHNGVVVSKQRRADPHVVSIKNQPFKGITTIVVESTSNGSWRFG
jgi:uncharacterized repeat protein (TIGR01451 family)